MLRGREAAHRAEGLQAVSPSKPPCRQPVDIDLNARLGAVIRQKRTLLGMSQDALGKKLGITFQQVQKYEKGSNQVMFPRLVEIAAALGTSAPELVALALGDESARPAVVPNRETLEMVKRFERLKPNQKMGVRLLVRSLAGEAA